MNLIDYVNENEEVIVNVTEIMLRDLLEIHACLYDYKEVKEELIEDWRIDDFVADYVNFGELAEADGFDIVDGDTYIHKSRFDCFLRDVSCYDGDCMLMYNAHFD